MKTTFSEQRMDFSKRAHQAARSQFYGRMFPELPLVFEDTVGTIRDLEYAIDCQVAVTVPGLRASLGFSVQERWRKPQEMHWGDVTITEWNRASNQPSELHKLGAQLFVYGFYDEDADSILAGVAINVLTVLLKLANGTLNYTRRSRLDQTFLGFGVRQLRAVGAVAFEVDNRRAAFEPASDDWPEVRRPPDWQAA